MRGMREAARQNPGPRASDVEKRGGLLEPEVRLALEDREAFGRAHAVVLEEREPRLVGRQRRTGHRNADHRPHPGVFADALVNHVLEGRSGSWLGTIPHALVWYLRP